MKDKCEKGYHKLIIWRKAFDLVLLVYKYTENFPRSEEFGLKSQLRRAAISVVLTIVEGHRRKSTKDFLRFLDMAVSSLAEIEAAFELCLALGFITEKDYSEIEELRSEEAVLLGAFIKGVHKKQL